MIVSTLAAIAAQYLQSVPPGMVTAGVETTTPLRGGPRHARRAGWPLGRGVKSPNARPSTLILPIPTGSFRSLPRGFEHSGRSPSRAVRAETGGVPRRSMRGCAPSLLSLDVPWGVILILTGLRAARLATHDVNHGQPPVSGGRSARGLSKMRGTGGQVPWQGEQGVRGTAQSQPDERKGRP